MALVDEAGKLVANRRISDDVQGYRRLLELLAEVGDSAEAPIPVAIGTARGLMIACLPTTGRKVYSINPMAVARYRERHSVARAKSDHADAVRWRTFCALTPMRTARCRHAAVRPRDPMRAWPLSGPRPPASSPTQTSRRQ